MTTTRTSATRKAQDTDQAPSHIREQILLSSAASILVGVAYWILPYQLQVGPSWLLFVILAVIVLPLTYASFMRLLPYEWSRRIRFGIQALLTLALLVSIILMVSRLGQLATGGGLLRAAAMLWASNVLVFSLWFWEIDGDGPLMRHKKGHIAIDFQFPQQADGKPMTWRPGFIDYLFLGFCSATALSPADTVPLTQRAKMLMMLEAIFSMIILALIIGRSVNIL